MAEHTPTPWQAMHQYLLTPRGPLPIASGYHDYVTTPGGAMYQEAIANAAFVAKAVNNHDPLMKALADIAAMDPWGKRADDLGRAARIARDVMNAVVGGSGQ